MYVINKFEIYKESKSKFPNIKVVNIDSFKVLVGRDSASNDHLTTVIAHPDDIWFHAKGVPGSHVVIETNGKSPNIDTIKEVAIIAAKNSKGVGSVNVVYCKAKYVTKKDNMKVGQVSIDYDKSHEINVEI